MHQLIILMFIGIKLILVEKYLHIKFFFLLYEHLSLMLDLRSLKCFSFKTCAEVNIKSSFLLQGIIELLLPFIHISSNFVEQFLTIHSFLDELGI